LEFASGLHGQLTSIWHRMIGRPSNRRIEVFAENLFVASDYDSTGPILVQRGNGSSQEIIGEEEVMARFAEILLAERPYLSPFKDSFAIPYALEDAAFIAALRGQCEVDPVFEEGVRAQQLVEAAYESARRAAPIDVKS